MYIHREFRCLISPVTETQCSKHVALGRDADAGTPAFTGFVPDVFPHFTFHPLELIILRISFYLLNDGINLLLLQVDDIIHYAL